MRKRIDGADAVEEHHGRDEEAPQDKLIAAGGEGRVVQSKETTQSVQSQAQKERRQPIEAIEKDQFRITAEVANNFIARGHVAVGSDPTDMGPYETAFNR